MFILFMLLFSITLISIFFKYLFKYRNAKFSYISFLRLIISKIKQEGIKRIILTNLGRGLFLSFMLFVFFIVKNSISFISISLIINFLIYSIYTIICFILIELFLKVLKI